MSTNEDTDEQAGSQEDVQIYMTLSTLKKKKSKRKKAISYKASLIS